jgi:hypothetical protein
MSDNPYIKPLAKAAKAGGLEGLDAEYRRREAQLAAAYDRAHFTIVPRPYQDGTFTDGGEA